MSLDASRLERVRELPGGIVQARCPACAEGGHDRSGEHLRIYPDGRFGCCVHPKEKEHRKRIFALAGNRKPGTFTVRLKAPKSSPAIQSVKAALTSPPILTPEIELKNGVRDVRAVSNVKSRTPRTDVFELRARTRGDSTTDIDIGVGSQMKLKDSEQCVRDVRTGKLPYLAGDGTLVIPFGSPERYHWWKGGQTIAETRDELKRRIADAVNV